MHNVQLKDWGESYTSQAQTQHPHQLMIPAEDRNNETGLEASPSVLSVE